MVHEMRRLLFGIFLLATIFEARAVLVNSILLRTLVLRQLSLSCRCTDKLDFCDDLESICVEDDIVKVNCPITCGICTECDSPSDPTLIPPVDECDLEETCYDRFALAICDHYSEADLCDQRFVKPNCRKTCGHCTPCSLPPPTPPPCKTDCVDALPACPFWYTKDFCDAGGPYPDVRFVCQRTCEICIPCPGT